MSWFDKLMPSRINTEKRRRSVPEGLWVKCEGCSAQLYRAELKRNLYVCPKCAHHLRIGARERLAMFLDADSGEEIAANLEPTDPLKFRDSKRYRDRLAQAQKATEERDALVVMAGTLERIPIVAAAFEFRFLGGSMGSVVGERFARAVSHCLEHERPFVCFAASGGARMQEALYSLMQMAKTSAALAALAEAGLPYISVMTDPTTGGVSASLAFLGDVNIAEPRSLIGFAGPRVIEQTVKERLPDGFQRAEFLLEKGALDMIVDRRRARREIASLLRKMLGLDAARAAAAEAPAEPEPAPVAGEAGPPERVESVEIEMAAELEPLGEEAALLPEGLEPAAEVPAPGPKGKAHKAPKHAKAVKAAKASKAAKAAAKGAAGTPAPAPEDETAEPQPEAATEGERGVPPGAKATPQAGAAARGGATQGAAASGAASPGAASPGAASPGAASPGGSTAGASAPGAAVQGPYRASGTPPGAAAPGAPIAPLPKQGAAPFASGEGAAAPAETHAAADAADEQALAEAEAERKGERDEAETAAAGAQHTED